MPQINVIQPFTLTKNDGSQQKFGIGPHEVPDDIAEHPFVIVHSDKAPPYEPAPGTPEFAKAAAKKMARRRLLKEAAEAIAEEDAEKQRIRGSSESRV